MAENTKNIMDKAKNILSFSELDCTVCIEQMVGKIYLCETGHSICENCIKRNLKTCGECRSPLTKTRNFKMEALVKQTKIIYDYLYELGHTECSFPECKQLLTFPEKKEHEENCEHRKILCSYSKYGCRYESTLKKLLEHESKCKKRLTPCRYRSYGCSVVMENSELLNHELLCPKKTNVSDKLNELLFKCTSCWKFLNGEVYVYKHHVFCEKCKIRSKECARNDRLQDIIENVNKLVVLPCTFKENGCKLILKLSHKNRHNAECPFRDIICHIPSCRWKACITGLLEHVTTEHLPVDFALCNQISDNSFGSSFTLTEDYVCSMKKYTFIYENNVFYLIQFRSPRSTSVKFLLVLAGPPREASKYRFQLRVNGQNKALQGRNACISDTLLVMYNDFPMLLFKDSDFLAFKLENGTYDGHLTIRNGTFNG